MKPAALFVVVPLALLSLPDAGPTAPPLPHPHFQKTLECRVVRELTVTVRYQTATFDREGAEKMKPGESWHLAGATFETNGDLVVGGRAIEAGTYALSARKTEAGGFELTLHEGRGFSLPKGDSVLALETRLDKDSLRYEHLGIDVQPAGDKEHTRLGLEVRFDTMWAVASIEVPEPKEQKR